MALNYELKEIQNWRAVCLEKTAEGEKLRQETHTLIFACMAVGLSGITTKNAKEWWKRHVIWSKLKGFEPLGYEVVCDHIGLKTNVTDEPAGRWRTRTLDTFIADFEYDLWRKLQAEMELVPTAKK